MKNFAAWFMNLRKIPKPPINDAIITGNTFWFDRDTPEKLELYYKDRAEAMQLDIAQLKKQIVQCATERRTCTFVDFTEQLNSLLDATKAMAHQVLLGANENSEIAKIIKANWEDERKKLLFMVFSAIDISVEEAEVIYNEMDIS